MKKEDWIEKWHEEIISKVMPTKEAMEMWSGKPLDVLHAVIDATIKRTKKEYGGKNE